MSRSYQVCVSIAEPDVDSCLKAISGQKFAEIRLDKMELDTEDVKKIFASRTTKLIATCRPDGTIRGEQERMKVLLMAIKSGASYVDIEVEASDQYKKEIVDAARVMKCKAIISYHNYKKTPSRTELDQILGWCFDSGADIAKIACTVCSSQENARLLGLLDNSRPIVVVGMGQSGRITRILAPLLGSQFTFASLEKGKETADGQMTKKELEEIINLIREAGEKDD